MAKRKYVSFGEKLEKARETTRGRLKKIIEKSVDHVLDNKSPDYIAAYELLQLALVERVTQGRITVSKLESIANGLKAGTNKKDAADSAKSYDKKISTEEYIKRRKAGEPYKQIKADFPDQDLRGHERAYGRSIKGKKELTGDLYRTLFQKEFHTRNPRKVDKEKVQKFDNKILKDYAVPSRNVLGGYRARFHKSW